jgi:hypothetical protein
LKVTSGRSPYFGVPKTKWPAKTQELVDAHPLQAETIVEVVLSAWKDIFGSRIGIMVIGKDIFPRPQVMGFFLHELIARELARRYPKQWRPEDTSADKDVVSLVDERYSFEVSVPR